MEPKVQDLSQFRLPAEFRGRGAVTVQLWWAVQATLFRWSPQFAYGFRRVLLRAFGARIGRGVLVRPTAEITYPWKLDVGDHAWIGDDVVLYTLGDIKVGANSVISQRSYICAADHDMAMVDFNIRALPISIGSQVWIATDVFIAPGVSIADGAVIGARSSVFADQPAFQLCVGSPCRPIRPRPTLVCGSASPTSVRRPNAASDRDVRHAKDAKKLDSEKFNALDVEFTQHVADDYP